MTPSVRLLTGFSARPGEYPVCTVPDGLYLGARAVTAKLGQYEMGFKERTTNGNKYLLQKLPL
jgi:hypothetical protein